MRLSLLALCFAACHSPARLAIKTKPDAALNRPGETFTMRGVVYDRNDMIIDIADPIIWQSSAPKVASVGADGVVTAVGSGQTNISGSYQNVSDSVALAVDIVASVDITPAESKPLKLGQTLQLKAIVKNEHGDIIPDAKVRWSTSNAAVSVARDGFVAAQAIGESEVYADARGKIASVRVKTKE